MAALGKYRRAAVQAIASGSNIDISFDTQDINGIGATWNGSNIVTLGQSGLYAVGLFLDWASNPFGYGLTFAFGSQSWNMPSGGINASFDQRFAQTMYLLAGDQLKVTLNQPSGGTVNLLSTLLLRYLGG